MYFYYLSSFHPDFSELNSGIRQTGRERISVIIYEGIEEKAFRLPSGYSVRELAHTIQGLITGNVIMAATERGHDIKAMEATVKTVLRLLAGG